MVVKFEDVLKIPDHSGYQDKEDMMSIGLGQKKFNVMNKSIEIKHFSLIDYNILLKVVSQYVKQYQISRDKFEYEKDMFDLTDTLYAL